MKQFDQLITDDIDQLLKHSCSYGYDYASWVNARQFIIHSIHKSGTFLDAGCANGFLVRCLQEWSPYKLEIYGFDTNPALIKEANERFCFSYKHFVTKNLLDYIKGLSVDLPDQFDFIYCSIAHTPLVAEALLKRVKVGGRLIFGFYGGQNNSSLKKQFNQRIAEIEEFGIKFDLQFWNQRGFDNLVAYITKTP